MTSPSAPRARSIAGVVVVALGLSLPLWADDAARGLLGDWFGPDAWRIDATRPPSHGAHFLQTHGQAIASGDTSCTSCHTEASCQQCHAGLVAPVTVHPPGYIAFHGLDARDGIAGCAGCHTPSRWCASCHIDARVWSDAPARPSPGFGVHPPGWVTGGPIHHAEEARRDLQSCASCHSGDSCVACHAWVNPHGPGFHRRCRSMLDAGAPTCAGCHRPDSALPYELLRGHPGCER
jgi:hypothetical protein